MALDSEEKGFSPLQVKPSTHRRFRVLAAIHKEDIYKLADEAVALLEKSRGTDLSGVMPSPETAGNTVAAAS